MGRQDALHREPWNATCEPTLPGTVARTGAETMTPAEMSVAALTAWMLDIASGVPLPNDEEAQAVYMVGFAAGAKFLLETIKLEVL